MRFGITFLALFLWHFSLSAQVKMGFVDLQKTVQATSAGKKARSELDAEFAKRKKELDRQETELRRKDKQLESKKLSLPEKTYRQQQAALDKQVGEFRDLMGRTQIDFQKKELELTTPILEKARRVIAKVAKENGYTVVMELTAQVLYAPEGDDLTDKVIREFEK